MCGGTERLSIEAEAFHNFFWRLQRRKEIDEIACM